MCLLKDKGGLGFHNSILVIQNSISYPKFYSLSLSLSIYIYIYILTHSQFFLLKNLASVFLILTQNDGAHTSAWVRTIFPYSGKLSLQLRDETTL